MDSKEFADKLLHELRLNEIDFASDVERLMAEQINYLRELIVAANQKNQLASDGLVAELRGRLKDMEDQINWLRQENYELRSQLKERIA